MRTIRFLKPYPPYNAGECAGFDPDVAGRLVARHIAERVEPTPSTAPEAPAASLPVEASAPAPAKGKKG